jgi:hypothetical protein
MHPNEFRNGHGKPVVALDIDGSLGDYHKHFLQFAEKFFGRIMPDPLNINRGKPLWEHMRVTEWEYNQAKLAYRQGGFKRWMPCYEGAAELTKSIHAEGGEVWITTTRPYLRLDNIDPDTREWLRRNHIAYDAVLFGRDKYRELVRQVGRARIAAVFDDLPKYLSQAYAEVIPNIYIMDQPYNRDFTPPWADRVDNLTDLQDYVLPAVERIREWTTQSRTEK